MKMGRQVLYFLSRIRKKLKSTSAKDFFFTDFTVPYLIAVNVVVGHQALNGPDGLECALICHLFKQSLIFLRIPEEEVHALWQSQFDILKKK